MERNRDKTVDVILVRIAEVEADEMWSYVGNKKNQVWLWWALDHLTNEPLAYVFGTKEHVYVDHLRDMLGVYCIIGTFYTDGNPAYQRIVESDVVQGKENMQKIEGRHIGLRTWCSRLVRKGIRFSKTLQMHMIVVGLVINYWYFGNRFW